MQLKNPFTPKEVHSNSGNNPPETPNAMASQPDAPDSKAPWWVGAALAALIVAFVFVILVQYQANADMVIQLEDTSRQLHALELRTAQLEGRLVEVQAESEATSADLESTTKKLKQTRAAAWRLRQDHKKVSAQLNQTLEAHEVQLASINDEVVEVKDNVSEAQDILADTRVELGRAVGDLGMQSGLIARNQEELRELKRRGEREYIEFDLRESKQYTRVGDLAVRLNRADKKRGKFTLTVLQNDRRIEKKDRTLYEPVQFYTGERGRLLELVVFELDKNRVAGYLSLPKEEIASNIPIE